MAEQPIKPEPQDGAPVDPEAPAAEAADGASPVSAAEAPAQEAPAADVEAAPAADAAPAVEPEAAPATGAAPVAQPAVEPEPASEPAPAPAPEPAPTAQAAGAVPPPPPASTPVVPVAPASQPKPKPTFAQGCLSAAWDDIKSNPNWLKKVLFLALVMCVPILNFVVYGYVLNWVREVPFGGRTALPKEVVTGRNFEVGFYYFVISLVFGLAAGFVGVCVGWVPLIGWLASIAVSIFAAMLIALCSVRMAMSKQLGEGFKLGRVWEAMKANWSGLLFLTFVPSLVAGAIMFVLLLIVTSLLLVGALPVIMSASGIAEVSTAVLATLVPLGVLGFVVILAVVYVCVGFDVVALLLVDRAAGHYIGRYAPSWADEAKVAMGYPVD